jgi:hypothetical protein
MGLDSLNALYATPSMRRRYEAWFLRLHLADGSGAWWFRYVLLNPGHPGGGGCPGKSLGEPVQVWATWFPRGGRPQSVIQGFPREGLSLSARGAGPFRLELGANRIGEDACAGRAEADGNATSWDLSYKSTFGTTVTDWGWIGFSRTPHSDAVFSGTISFDGKTWQGDPLGYGVQGHNCGFRHRHFWSWAHCFSGDSGHGASTFEALDYEIPLGLRVRRAVLWHGGQVYTFKNLATTVRDPQKLRWELRCSNPKDGCVVAAVIDGSGQSIHRLPYRATDCSSTFEVANNSLARATLYLSRPGRPMEEILSEGGTVLEMVGN